MLDEQLRNLSYDIRRTIAKERQLPFFHSSKAQIFLDIFSAEYPRLGLGYPCYFFYGKPSFFSQFSGKLNKMAIAVSMPAFEDNKYTLHDSDLAAWPFDVRLEFERSLGRNPLTLEGDLDCIRKAAVYIFGDNSRYFRGEVPKWNIEAGIIGAFSVFLRGIARFGSAEMEKVRTIEIKTDPLDLRLDSTTVYFVSPNTTLKESASISIDLEEERDSARSLLMAADKAAEKGFSVVDCLDQRARPIEIDSLYVQLFHLIEQHLSDDSRS